MKYLAILFAVLSGCAIDHRHTLTAICDMVLALICVED